MKRAISLVLTFVMLLSLLPVAAFADGTTITASATTDPVNIGDTVNVTFSISGNPGFTDLILKLNFNENVLQFTGLKKMDAVPTLNDGLIAAANATPNTIIGNADYGKISGSSATPVTGDGTFFVAQFTAIGAGDTTVGATLNEFGLTDDNAQTTSHLSSTTVTDSNTITVAGIPATAVTISHSTLSLYTGQNQLLSATVEPSNSTDEVVWDSSDDAVATVTEYGQVVAVAAGTANITATAGDVSATCAVTVTAEQSVVGKSVKGYGNWDDTAALTGIRSVTVGGATKTVKNIYKLSLTGHEETYLHVSGSSYSGGVAYDLKGTAIVGAQWGTDMTKQGLNFSWADIHTKELLVSEAELTAAVGAANVAKLGLLADKLYAFLYVEDSMANQNCGILFEITPVLATSLEITETLALDKGKTGAITAAITPSGSSAEVTWSSSNEAVATVDATGMVTAVGAGTATITATAVQGEATLTDTCTVTVVTAFTISDIPGNGDDWGGVLTSIDVSGVESLGHAWNGKTLNIFVAEDTNATATLKFNISTYGGYETSTDTATVTISDGAGTHSGSHAVDNWTVNFCQPVPATGITLNKTATEIAVGKNETLTAAVEPANSTDAVTWKSSNEAIAKVATNGKVTGVAAGEATITATAGNVSAECKVTVYAVPAASVTISGDRIENGKLRLLKGEQYKPTVTITPEDTTDSVTYKSGNTSVAAVTTFGTNKGQIIARAAGTATYTVTAGNVSASIEVEVYEEYGITIGEMENGTVTADPASAAEGETVTLTVTPAEGYMLDTLTVMNGETPVVVKDNTFTMPAAAVTVSATFTQTPNPIRSVEAKNPLLTKTSAEDAAPVYSVTLMSGVTEDLLLDITVENPDKEATQQLTWSSTHPTVAKVEGGKLITGTVNESTTVILTATVTSEAAVAAIDGEGSDALITLNVTVNPVDAGYTVNMGPDKNVDADETIQIPVTVTHTDGTVESYKSFELVFQYDPTVLTLVTGSSDTEGKEITVIDNNGTVTVRRYGGALSVGTAAITLEFTANKTGEANVKLTGAKVGTSDDAQSEDIPTAQIMDNITLITVTGYTVSLPQDFEGKTVVVPGEDYTFTAKDLNYEYTITATIDGQPLTVTGSGTDTDPYKITADQITGNIQITTEKSGKKFEITLNGDSLAHESGYNTEGEKTYVQYMKPYTAKLTKKEHYIYDPKVTVNGETVAHVYDSETGIITIAGNLITGPVVIESGEQESEKHDVDFVGAYASHAQYEGDSAVYDGDSFSFTIETPEGLVIESYQVSYKLGDATEYTALEAVEGTYTIENVTAALTIKIEGTSDLKVEVNEYVKLDGKVVFLVTATQTLPEGKSLAYNTEGMYLKNFTVDGSDTMALMYSYLVVVNSGETLSVEAAAAMITIIEAKATTLEDTFNVNESTALDINDAQLVYDLYNNEYQDITTVGMQKFLRADVNGSRNINVSDAAAVVNAILAENQ